VKRSGTALFLATLLAAGPAEWAPGAGAEEASRLPALEIAGDAMPRSLTSEPGDAGRGREVVMSRERGNCVACHVVPSPEQRSHGNVGPSLDGVGSRLSQGQLRLRLVDARRLNAASVMPSYYRQDGLTRVAQAYAGKPVLTAQEIEDAVAFLMTLRQDGKR
jgi:sulfur-oxidizing protein SoxX